MSFVFHTPLTVNLSCGISYDEKTKVWISYCPELELTSQGETELEAKEAIRSGINLYLSCAREMNLALVKPVRATIQQQSEHLWKASGMDISLVVCQDTEENVREEFKKRFVDMIKSQTEQAYGPFHRIKELNPRYRFKKVLSLARVS